MEIANYLAPRPGIDNFNNVCLGIVKANPKYITIITLSWIQSAELSGGSDRLNSLCQLGVTKDEFISGLELAGNYRLAENLKTGQASSGLSLRELPVGVGVGMATIPTLASALTPMLAPAPAPTPKLTGSRFRKPTASTIAIPTFIAAYASDKSMTYIRDFLDDDGKYISDITEANQTFAGVIDHPEFKTRTCGLYINITQADGTPVEESSRTIVSTATVTQSDTKKPVVGTSRPTFSVMFDEDEPAPVPKTFTKGGITRTIPVKPRAPLFVVLGINKTTGLVDDELLIPDTPKKSVAIELATDLSASDPNTLHVVYGRISNTEIKSANSNIKDLVNVKEKKKCDDEGMLSADE